MPNQGDGKKFVYDYLDIQKLVDMDIAAVYQAASRGTRRVKSGFDPSNFESTVRWVFRNASDEFKMQLLGEMGFFRKKPY
jgi:hypothetical protein